MMTLEKPTQSQTLTLAKGSGRLTVTARWVDNGDGFDNDDLDLRAGILLPNGQMHWIDPLPDSVPVLMRELWNSPRGVSEGGA